MMQERNVIILTYSTVTIIFIYIYTIINYSMKKLISNISIIIKLLNKLESPDKLLRVNIMTDNLN